MVYRVPKAIRCGPKQVVFLILLLVTSVVLCYWYFEDSYRRYNPYILRHLPENSEHIYTSFSNSELADLQSNIPLLTVHYLWCQSEKRNAFEHRHYLGILSILKQLHPDQIFFHYDDLPLSENSAVNWIKDLKRDVAILNFRPMTSADSLCSAKPLGLKMNGIFVESDVIVTNLSRAYVISKMGFCGKSKNSCTKNNLYPPAGKLLLTSSTSVNFRENVEVVNCQQVKQMNSKIFLPKCVSSDNQFKVNDIQQGDNNFHKSMRTILYGNPDKVQPISSSSSIPLYGHIVSETFTFKVYISILSAVTYGQLKTIFFHGTELPYGTYWKKLKETGAKIHFVEVDSKTFPNTKAALHQYNFYILWQYGGILFTEHVIWQNKIPPDLLKFETVGTTLSVEGDTKLIDLNVLMAKPGAFFLQSILAVSQQLGSQSNELIINYASYHVYELYPKYVYLHTKLIGFVNCDRVCSVDHEALAIVDNNSIITDEELFHKVFKL